MPPGSSRSSSRWSAGTRSVPTCFRTCWPTTSRARSRSRRCWRRSSTTGSSGWLRCGFPLLGLVDPEIGDPSMVLGELADGLLARGETIVGFTGRRRTVQVLAQAWSQRTGVDVKPRMWELLYRLGELIPPVGVPGAARVASMDSPADVALLADWFCEFRKETGVGRG